MSALYTLEAANMFCGKGKESNSLHLKLTEVKLPAIEEAYADHRSLGALVAVEIDTGVNRLECNFAIVGVDPQVASLPLSWFEDHQWFFFFGLLRDRQTGIAKKASVEMRGRLGRVDPQNWRRGDVLNTAGQIRAIVYYKFEIGIDANKTVVYEWDYYNNVFYINGDNRMRDINECLNIPSAAPYTIGTKFDQV